MAGMAGYAAKHRQIKPGLHGMGVASTIRIVFMETLHYTDELPGETP